MALQDEVQQLGSNIQTLNTSVTAALLALADARAGQAPAGLEAAIADANQNLVSAANALAQAAQPPAQP